MRSEPTTLHQRLYHLRHTAIRERISAAALKPPPPPVFPLVQAIIKPAAEPEPAPHFPHRRQLADAIVREVACRFGLTATDLYGEGRTHPICLARHCAMYLIRQMCGFSMPRIARRFGDRDHTSVMHGWRKITRLRQIDGDLDAMLTEISNEMARRFDG